MAFGEDDFTFTWKIENFSCLSHQEGELLKSAEFFVEPVMHSHWCLWLYPKGLTTNNGEGKGHISLFLRNMDATPSTVFYYASLETTDGEFEIQKRKKCQKHTFTNCSLGNFKTISLESLYEKKHLYLPQDILTVKCYILSDNKKDQIPNNSKLSMVPNSIRIQCLSITRIQVQKRSLTWPLQKIRKLWKSRKPTSILSNCALKTTPSLILSFSICNDSDKEYAKIKIMPIINSPYAGKRLFVKCKITILTANKIYHASMEDTHLFNLKLDDKWIFPSFINIKNLKYGRYISLDDTLVLQWDFAFSYPGTEYHVEAPHYAPWHLEVNKPPVNQLCGSIGHAYANGDLCDVNLHADGKTFPAHKLVLCARSPVFRAMFENDMKEKDTNLVDIADVDAGTLERFLRFLHSDIVDEELTSEEASNLYKAADKYQVDLLKQKCSILLLSTLSVTSVCDVIVLAKIHKDNFLTSAAENFLQYHFHETLHSKEWKDFMDSCPKLSGIIMFKALKSKSFL